MQNFCIFENDAKLLRRTLDHSNFSCKSVTDCVRFSRAAFLPINSESISKLGSHMTLRASLLRGLVNPNLSVGGRAKLCCDLARDFEDRGEYEEAHELLSGLWPHPGERPTLEGLDRSTAAEVLLRVGALTGIIGSSNQIKDAQQTARNLITESLGLFQSQRDNRKIAEAQTELALSYWRTGEYNEASALLKHALSQLTTDIELKAKAIQRLAMVEQYARRPREALRFLTENAALFEKIRNQTLTGCYHQTLGDALENLWESEGPEDYLDRALVEYAAASYHFEQADHKRYRANVENNLGFLYLKISFFKEAHQHLDRARRIFTSLKDRGAVAQVDETRARAFLQQGRNAEAEKAADSSVRTLEKSDMQAELAESLTTHGRALARLGKYGMALSAFRHAIKLSQKIGSRNRAAEAAMAVFQEMEERLAVVDQMDIVTGRNLSEEIQLLEHDLIKHALETNKGIVTRSARALGISYQELSYMLNTRHADLLNLRTPPRRRKP